jgi:hypothetical protein
MSLSPIWKLWFSGSNPFKNYLNSHWATMHYMLLLLTQVVFFREIHVFLQLSWIGLSGANRAIPTLKTVICRKYSFQILTQFSKGNNVLDPPDSNTNGGLWGDTCVPSTWLSRPIRSKQILSPPWNSYLQEVLLSNINSIFTLETKL